MLDTEGNRLCYRYDTETLWIEPWGRNALRVRSTRNCIMPLEDWALLPSDNPKASILISDKEATIANGKITATVSRRGKITMHNQKRDLLLEEFARHRFDLEDPKCSSLGVEAREFRPVPGGSDNYHLMMRLESLSSSEKLYGMGQYQQPILDLKGSDLELAQRNSQASVPFLLSSLGYGLLWNNPAIGRATLGKNVMSFEAHSTKILDYWIVAGDMPSDIIEAYADATGKPPMMPEYGLGFWQCKLRYQTQDELLRIAREYVRRGIKLDVIVIDFFHWPFQGTWKFDEEFWPDPDSMIKELTSHDIELMVSIWPTVDKRSPLYPKMLESGYLIRTDRGIRTAMDFMGDTLHYDATNPAARRYVWETCKQNYYDKGVKVFWLDEAEPEYSVYDYDNYRYWLGSDLEIGNLYPREYARTFYEGMTEAGQKNVVNLLRCAWAGSQKYGALVWSGDIASSWWSFRNQFAAGLHMGMAGIPWWTTDIGGFHGGDPNDPKFRELLVRWFQWGAFCPVMRLHGDREPKQAKVREGGGSDCLSGAPNEIWSFGTEVEEICRKYLKMREWLRDYVRALMKEASERGSPLMRTMFYCFPKDDRCWDEGVGVSQYMFGPRYLCAPVLEEGIRKRTVYLPEGEKWRLLKVDGSIDQVEHDGGQVIETDCPLDYMPVFVRK